MMASTSRTGRIGPGSAATRARGGAPPIDGRVAVFTAVDGALLDPVTFDPGANRQAVARLQAAGVPVIPVSVMTLDEIEPIARELQLRTAMVIEAGGAIARWDGGTWVVEPCGPPAEMLLDVVRDIEDRSGASLVVYSVMAEREAARASGRSGEMLERSMRRSFSEPFLIESGDVEAVARAAASVGFSLRQSSRFFHLCRQCGEGEAFARVRAELGIETAVALGGSAIDAQFLSRAELPIIMRRRDGQPDPELLAKVPAARIAPAPAPDGWAAAINAAWPVFAPGMRAHSGTPPGAPKARHRHLRTRAERRPEGPAARVPVSR